MIMTTIISFLFNCMKTIVSFTFSTFDIDLMNGRFKFSIMNQIDNKNDKNCLIFLITSKEAIQTQNGLT